jgi:hypothetical protein
MNRSLVAIGLMTSLSLVGTAHAELLVGKGTRATVTVEMTYSAVGMKKDKYDPREWKVNRSATITSVYEAQKPQAMAQLRAPEAAQMANLKDKQATAVSAHKKMQPMMADMMKIVEKCGESEACIEKEVEAYGNSMEMTPDLKSAGKDIEKLGKVDGPRYQLWNQVSQRASYSIDEYYKGQTADPACMEKPGARCHREETRNGNGNLPPPPGKSGIGKFEVDAQKKDLVIILPSLMAPVTYNRVVKSDFPDEAAGNSQGLVTGGLAASKPLTVAIPLDLKKLSGTEQIKQEGAEGEGGITTVRWTITVP